MAEQLSPRPDRDPLDHRTTPKGVWSGRSDQMAVGRTSGRIAAVNEPTKALKNQTAVTDLGEELAVRLQAAVAVHARRKRQRAQTRAQLAAARAVGLEARHQHQVGKEGDPHRGQEERGLSVHTAQALRRALGAAVAGREEELVA